MMSLWGILKTGGLGALTTFLAITTASAQEPKWETVKIGTEGAYPPWNFTGPGGKLEGFEIDLISDLCPRMKVKCEIVVQDWDGLIPALNARKFDAIVAGMLITDERMKAINFSRNYATGSANFLVRKGIPFAGLPEGKIIDLGVDPAAAKAAAAEMLPKMKGLVVGVQGSTPGVKMMEQMFPGVEVREYKTTEQHDLDLAAGRIDAILAGPVALDHTLKSLGSDKFVFAGTAFTGGYLGSGQAAGLRKSDTKLKQMFDEAIGAALADSTVSKLATKWFGRDISAKN